MLGDPSGDAFAQIEAYGAHFYVMGQLRCAEHNFSCLMVWQIDQAGVASGYPNRDGDEFLQHIVDRETGADNSACTMRMATSHPAASFPFCILYSQLPLAPSGFIAIVGRVS